MIKLEIHVDEKTAERGKRVANALGSRKARVLLLVGLIAVPAIAIAAPLTVPNTFSSGTVISSSEVNANFAAAKTAIDDNDTRIATLEGNTALNDCVWAENTATGFGVSATCPANHFVISGACETIGTLDFSRPNANQVSNGAPATGVTSWGCQYTNSASHTAVALCCPM